MRLFLGRFVSLLILVALSLKMKIFSNKSLFLQNFKTAFLTLISVILLTLITFNHSQAANSSRDLASWKNISAQSIKSGPSQSNANYRPALTDNIFGPLPGIRFDGTDNFLNDDSRSSSIKKDYTIFFVEKRTSDKANNYFLGNITPSGTNNVGLALGYETDTTLVFSQGGNKETIAIEPYSESSKPVSHVFVHDSVNGKKYYRNGALVFANASNTSGVDIDTGAVVGRNGNDYFDGNIGEYAIYSRALTAAEITRNTLSLATKWKLEVTTDDTVCLGTSTPHSPGYVTIANGVWPDAANGGNSAINCTVGGEVVIGTIDDMLCTNGVWSSGVTTGTCGVLNCTTDPDDAPHTLANGDWGVASATDSQVINGICNGGFAGAPTIQCVSGSYVNPTGGCVTSNDCGANSSGHIDISGIPNAQDWNYNGSAIPGYQLHGTILPFACSPTFSQGIDLIGMRCISGSWNDGYWHNQSTTAIAGASTAICGTTSCGLPPSFTNGRWTYTNWSDPGEQPRYVTSGYETMELKLECTPGNTFSGAGYTNKVCSGGSWIAGTGSGSCS
jgi:hypothetical protein